MQHRHCNAKFGLSISSISPEGWQVKLQKCAPLPTYLLVAVLLAGRIGAAPARADEKLGVRVPDGFEVTLYADDDLAHDIFSMTIDAFGRVAVSGPGYVRILVDEDGDGRADSFKQFADGPKTGAQGMYFLGRDLLCSGDAGLIRYRDQNGDDRADGPPDTFLNVKTGGEHDLHAIHKGPDGWWYVIAGNFAGITEGYATLSTSPVKKPAGGALLRMKPDLAGGEIFAHGFRNAYDFAFNRQGDIFTFDSDGERDVSLPWYRPTRVFHVLPGSHAGWVSRSWKHPHYFLDMPPVVGAFGRGSPSGVACYQHRQFPEPYRNALFILDWTFGRVIALPLERAGETWSSEPIDFMSGVGQFGFAPTAVAVGPKGSLYISVGGRGTRGGVFRITHTDGSQEAPTKPETPEETLTACLEAPQPLSSWSRARWLPLARELGRQPFLDAILDPEQPEVSRVRAIEIVTELFNGLDTEALEKLAADESPLVRARAVWSAGRTQTARPDTELIAAFLTDEDALVGRAALEALIGAGTETDFKPLIDGLAQQMASPARFNRQTAARVLPGLDEASFRTLAGAAVKRGWQAGLTNALGYLNRDEKGREYALKIGTMILQNDEFSSDLKLQATRLLQLALGGLGSRDDLPPAFDGYCSPMNLARLERQLDPIRIAAAQAFPTGNDELDVELSRLLALVTPYNPRVLDQLLQRITEESNPIDDIHYLLVAARIPVQRDASQRDALARALVDLGPKIDRRKLNQDSNWEHRISELYEQLVKIDPQLSVALLDQPNFGHPSHVRFFSKLPPQHLNRGIEAFVRRVEQDEDYPWTNGVVFVIGEGKTPRHREIVRQQFDHFALRPAVLMVLAESPEEQDRQKFIEGLDSSQVETLTACVEALSKLPPQPSAESDFTLLRTLRRLGADKREFPLREKVVLLLQRNTGLRFGFEFGPNGHRPQPQVIARWTEAIKNKYPDQAATHFGGSEAELEQLQQLLAQVDWQQGDIERGQHLFRSRACVQCHGGSQALGPDLAGAANRFSREDLFIAIALPNRDVSPRYQTTLIQTTAGKIYSGLIIYEAVDGLILRNATNQTFRIEADEIASQRKLNTSLMPTGLLKDLEPQDLADLYAYIRSLGTRSQATRASR